MTGSAKRRRSRAGVFVTVFKHIDTFRGDAKFSTWLYRIATNQTRNRMKYLGRRAHTIRSELDEAAERGGRVAASAMARTSPGPTPCSRGCARARRAARIAAAGAEHREVLVLRDVGKPSTRRSLHHQCAEMDRESHVHGRLALRRHGEGIGRIRMGRSSNVDHARATSLRYWDEDPAQESMSALEETEVLVVCRREYQTFEKTIGASAS